MIISWLLLLFIPQQAPDGFAQDILRAHTCYYEYLEDDWNLTIDQLENSDVQQRFLPKDSLKVARKFQHYWIKVYVPELEDNSTYYFNFYIPFDEMSIHFASGEPLTKNWYSASDTSRFVPGRSFVSFKKEDLYDGNYFYLRTYMATYSMGKFFFRVLNGKALYVFNHTMNSDRFISYHVFNVAYLGAIVIIFLYVLATYLYNRENVYLYYLIYLFAAGAYLFSRSTMVHDYFFPRITPQFPTIIYHVGYTVQYLMHISYLWFALAFLNAKNDYPLFHKVGKYMSVFFLLCIGVTIISIEFAPKTKLWLFLYQAERYAAILLTIAIQVYVFANRKDRLASFIVVGSMFFVTGAFISIVANEVFYFRVGAIIEILTFSMGLAYRLRQSESAKILLAKEVERVKMIALRTQMKPHFLFNTINSIRALILKGSKEEAYEHLAVFSKLIRYVLESSESELVPLSQELKMLDIYVDMEKRRLSHEFSYEHHVSPAVNSETLIPPLILQPFIENAIIHGLVPKEGSKNLEVNIEPADNLLKCTVTDNGIGRQNAAMKLKTEEKKSMAIELTEKRIAILSQTEKKESKSVRIHDLYDEDGQAGGTKVEVMLPLILRHETQNHLN